MIIKSTKRPKWYNIRWRISNLFVHIARIIDPGNPEVKAFYMQRITDALIYGKSIIRVNPEHIHIVDQKDETNE